MFIKSILFLVSIFLSLISYSQQSATYTSDIESFNKALELYENNQFLAAQSSFSSLKEKVKDETIKSNCAFYIANSAVRLNQQMLTI